MVKRFGVAAIAAASLGLFAAAPAYGVNHFFIPADECAASDNAGGEMGFDNVSAAPGQPFVKRGLHNEGPQAVNNSRAPDSCN
jgi:hypothetical protein